jgi:UDP-N-acetylglucosamine--dolichyl-phosphate N-acetylglucosaminephosphotransferase
MLEIIFALVLISFLMTYLVTPVLIRKLMGSGIYGIDVHKKSKPKVAEDGGIVIAFSVIFSLLIYIGYLTYINEPTINIMAAITSILIIAFLGFIDDILELRWRYKILLPLFASFPLMVARAGNTTMILPIIGLVDFGPIYTWLLIPIAMTGMANMTNMLAGFNGLEAGLGLINSIAIVIFGILMRRWEASIICSPLIGSLFAFLFYNWHPARVFPGDIGTFTIGATLVSAIIVGNIEKFGILISTLYILNFILFFIYFVFLKRKIIKFASIDKRGYIKPPHPFNVHWLFPYYLKELNEKQNVIILLIIQSLICIISFILVG